MRAQDPNTTVGFPELERSISVSTDNGNVLTEELARNDYAQRNTRDQTIARLRLLWEHRRFLARVTGAGLLLSTLFAFLISNHYQSVARLMPPDNQSSSAVAMAAAALSGSAAGGLGGIAGDLLGMRSTSDLLVGVLEVAGLVLDASFEGLRAQAGTAGVERAAARAVVFSSIFIILADVVLVRLILVFFP